jgi:hypothetical protein
VIQINVLSGKTAGSAWMARRFPVQIGRAEGSDLRLEEEGVWDQHLVLSLDGQGFSLKVHTNALARVNGQPVEEIHLRNGDTIELGIVRMQFWLSRLKQRALRLNEWLTWGGIVAVALGQIGILYWLLC